MNENYARIYDDEVEIDLRDLLFYLLRHWRSLIVVIILGALLGGGIYFAKKASFEKNASASVEQTDWVESYAVSPELKSKMDLAWENRQAYAKQLSYNQNSLIMQMDAEHVYNGRLKYYIAAGSATRLIAEQFNNVLNDGELAKELKTVAGLDCDSQYIRELIGCDVNTDSDSSINIASSMDETAPSTKNVVITYTVNYSEEKACRKMLAVLQDKVDQLANQLQKDYGGFTFEQLGSSVILTVNAGYLSQQKTHLDYLQSYANNYNSLEANFTDKDLEYYQIVYLGQEAHETEAAAFSESKLKWLILGIFAFICCWGFLLVLRYLFNKQIKTVDEVKMRYQLPILSVLQSKKNRKGIDGLIDRLEQAGHSYPDSVAYAAETIGLMNGNTMLLCKGNLTTRAENVVSELLAACPKLIAADYVGKDAHALEQAKTTDGIILTIEHEGTSYSDIERSLEACRIQGVKVFGAIFI